MNYNKNFDSRNKDRNKDRNRESSNDYVSEFRPEWIKNGFDNNTISFCENFGEYLAHGMTTSQIRNFFGEVKRIQLKGISKEKSAFYMLKPKLAYLAKRAEKKQTTKFKEVMDKAYEAVISDESQLEQSFKNYIDFLEAILAYHKAYGGRSN